MKVNTRALASAVLVLATVSCGDNGDAPADAPAAMVDAPAADPTLLARLNALPGVTAVATPTQTSGYTYIVLHFTQPVDHDDPSGPTFQQEVSLLSRDLAAPMIVETDGYWDYTLDEPVELTDLFTANQISIEHRFFADSIPANPDWTKLTIQQMAADEHAIVTALKTIYTGPYIASGASKGGMTSMYFRRFYPDDVAGTVPYVAPLSFAEGDERYATFLDNNGTQPCHQAVRDAAVEMLKNRRAALEAAAQAEATASSETFTQYPIPVAVESSVESLEWSFWQYNGVADCGTVPAVTATDAEMYAFLDNVSSVGDSDDAWIAAFAPYYYQSYYQLGYPDGGQDAYLGPYEMYGSDDDADVLPAGASAPEYDGGSAMHDVDDFVQTQGKDLVFIYGQWDPWTAGAFTLGSATDAQLLVEAEGTHDSILSELAPADRASATAAISAWLGSGAGSAAVVHRVRTHREPHVPPVMLRALRAHGRAHKR